MPETTPRKQALAHKLLLVGTLVERIERDNKGADWLIRSVSLSPSDACKRDILAAARGELEFAARTAAGPTAEELFRLTAKMESLLEIDETLAPFSGLLKSTVDVRLLSDALAGAL